MSQLLVLGRWPLTLRPGTGGHYAFLDTVSSKNASCFFHLVKDLPVGMSVVEYFGGVGIFSTIIQQTLRPSSHRVFDLDVDCVAQLQSILGVAQAEQGDAALTMGTVQAELVVLDFAYATFKHHDDWPWKQVVARAPRYIVFSDTALRRLGLHRALYSRLFGEPIHSHEDYIRAYSRFLWVSYGYSVTRVAHHQYSYLIAERVPFREDIEIRKVVPSGYSNSEHSR